MSDLLLRKRELELLKRKQEIRRDNALAFFRPHPKQELFFNAAEYVYRYVRTGNRFGKSEMGTAEDVSYAIGYRPWYPEGHRLRTLGIPSFPTKGLIVCTTWKKSREVFTEMESGALGKLWKYIPKSCYISHSKNHSGFIDRIVVRHVSGGQSVIFLDTIEGFKKNALAQESSVHDWVHIDEPIPEPMWKAIARGLVDRGGHAWFTCTPLTEPWIDQAFVPDYSADRQDVAQTFSSGERWMMTGSMRDNPHNSEKDIVDFLSWLTPDEQECRLNGLPVSFAGLVYKEFSWSTHVLREPPVGWKSWEEPPADHTLRFAIDYHPRKPHHVLFIATSPLDQHFVYAEVWRSCLMSELVEDIKAVLGPRGATVPGLIDPLAKTPNQVTDITPLDEVLRLGLPVLPATKDPSNGILKVKEVLSARDRTKQPILRINAALSRFLFEISRGFVWDGETNKPKKDNDDAMENLYRLCLQGLPYIPPTDDLDFVLQPRHFDVPEFSLSEWDEVPVRVPNPYAARYRR